MNDHIVLKKYIKCKTVETKNFFFKLQTEQHSVGNSKKQMKWQTLA